MKALLSLKPQSVADFYRETFDLVRGMGVSVAINEMPNEIPNPIRFSQDRIHSAYDAAAAHRFWRALVNADRIFRLFRSGFLGKVSPVHFFWGSFDLAVTRFSGRPAPRHPGGVPGLPDEVAREAYSHEVSSAGFWPGADAFPRAAFYSYAYPEPATFSRTDSYARRVLRHDARGIHPPVRHGRGRAPTRRLFCSTSCRPPMRPPPRPEAGTGPRSNARSAFRDACVRFEFLAFIGSCFRRLAGKLLPT